MKNKYNNRFLFKQIFKINKTNKTNLPQFCKYFIKMYRTCLYRITEPIHTINKCRQHIYMTNILYHDMESELYPDFSVTSMSFKQLVIPNN